MFKINGTTIELTRGDSMSCKVSIMQAGEEYQPQEGDSIRFAMKRHYLDADPLIEKIIPNDTMILSIDPEDTKNLMFSDDYVYDIEMTFSDGRVDTFIAEAKLMLRPEVK